MSETSHAVTGRVRPWWKLRNHRTSPCKRATKLNVEALEDRFVPATFVQTGGIVTASADLLHRYEFNNSLSDIFSDGPVLVDHGGTVAGGRYTFGANQGLQLNSGLLDTASYSIELVMEFDAVLEPQWKKLIDFTELQTDNGLYVLDANLTLYPDEVAGPEVVTPNTDFHVVITRNGTTGMTRIYLNGVFRAESNGTLGISPNNTVNFFEDDIATGGAEAQAGSVDYIAIYHGPLSDADVAALNEHRNAPGLTAVSVVEGQTATMSGTFHSSTTDAVTVVSSIGTVTQSSGAHGTWSWSFTADDGPAPSPTVTITSSDVNGNPSTTTFTLTVDNLAPTIDTLTSSATSGNPAQPGAPVTVQGSFSDPGTADTHHALITWGDGAQTVLNESDINQTANTFTANHAYANAGTFTVTVTLFDDDGGQVMGATTAVVVAVAPPTDGSATIRERTLYIVGNANSNRVHVERIEKDQVKVRADFLPNGKVSFNLADFDRIVVELGDGNDDFAIDGKINVPAVVHGGAGHDSLKGGVGPGVLLGEAGNDEIKGGRGRDILIGGVGRDVLKGGEDDDVLVGGTTNRDQDNDALFKALAIWTSNRSFAARAAEFKALVSVFDDFEADLLKGGVRCDLVFAGKGDIYRGQRKDGQMDHEDKKHEQKKQQDKDHGHKHGHGRKHHEHKVHKKNKGSKGHGRK